VFETSPPADSRWRIRFPPLREGTIGARREWDLNLLRDSETSLGAEMGAQVEGPVVLKAVAHGTRSRPNRARPT
jgi:hypothetical protein